MDIPNTLFFVGKRMRHELTEQEIRLVEPWKDGWRVKFLFAATPPGQDSYMAFLDTHTLAKNYLEVAE